MARDFETHITQGNANSDAYGRLFNLNRLAFLALQNQFMPFGKTDKMKTILLRTVTVAKHGLNSGLGLDTDKKSNCAKNLLDAALELAVRVDYSQVIFDALKQLFGNGYSQEIKSALTGRDTALQASQIFEHAFPALKRLIMDQEQFFSTNDIHELTSYFKNALKNKWMEKTDADSMITALQQKTNPDDAMADQMVSLWEHGDR